MQQYEQLHRVRQGDKEAREQMILDNMPLVWSMVGRFAYANREKEELFQVGMVGLMHAIDRFDTRYQVQFSTYAVPMILGEIKRFLRDDGPMKMTRSILEHRKQIRGLLEQDNDMTMEQLAENSGLSMEDVVLALGSEKPVESIYQPVYDAGEGEVLLVDGLPQKDKPVEQDVEEKQLLQQAFTALEPSEERLIRLRFFENKTQTQIGEILHMTQVQVSRMEKKILCKMRREIL
jgi:RNA polymerase sporulation-specific sigma factor